MTTDLAKKDCIPCRGGVPPLSRDKIQELLPQVPGWQVERDHHLWKEYKFPDFVQALAAVNRIGALAEAQGHHPDLYMAWGKVKVEIWTHKIDGLTESDFILAAKIEELV
jgi:4a-hydroxytetrahydrobiopterin dehydratase